MATLYILRHGEAHPWAPSDAQRSLTPRGQSQAQVAANWLIERPAPRIVCSEYLRAQQTAQLVAAVLGDTDGPSVMPGMTPDDSPRALLNSLAMALQSGDVLMVSHLPLVGLLTSLLLHGHTQAAPGFYTASMAAVAFEQFGVGLGELLWLNHVP